MSGPQAQRVVAIWSEFGRSQLAASNPQILPNGAPVMPSLRLLASFCKMDPSLWFTDALRSASVPSPDPNDRQASVIKMQLGELFPICIRFLALYVTAHELT
jgi:hypothetical protein